jgi:hypothetical protein
MNAFTMHIMIHPDSPEAPRYLYLPPEPPPLEAEIPVLPPFLSGPPAPGELEAFVGEPFYSFLADRLDSGDLPKPLRAEIVSYHEKRVGLEGELRREVLAAESQDPGARADSLARLAEAQDGRLAELESDAQRLFADLRPSGVLGLRVAGADPNDRLARGVGSPGATPTDPTALRREADRVRAAALLVVGLSPGQRGLLLEAAMDLDSLAKPPASAPPGSRWIAFSPATARIAVPLSPTASLAAAVDLYLSAKLALKSELRDRLWETREQSEDERRGSMEALAAAQAPRIARVEALAEDVRRELAAIPDASGPSNVPSLPAELTERITAYRQHKLVLLRTLRSLLSGTTPAGNGGPAGTGGRSADPERGTLAWTHDGSTATEIQPSNLRVSVSEFDHRQNELLTALNREEEGIRESLADYVRSNNGAADRKSVNDLLRDFENARQRQEIRDLYRDYRAAVLLPGLTPAERRVLFGAAVGELGLPLPAGTRTN